MKDRTNVHWEVQGDYGFGWEMLTAESTEAEALAQLACYDENEPAIRHRVARVTGLEEGAVDHA